MPSAPAERSPSTRTTSAASTSAPARKRSGKKLVKGPRQPRPTHSPAKDGAGRGLSLVEEHPGTTSEPPAESQNNGGSAMSVDMEAVSQVDVTAVRVEAMHELMMYMAQVMRESGMVAREQLRLSMLARGEEANLPPTPAIDSGFIGGPASRLLGVAFGSPVPTATETASSDALVETSTAAVETAAAEAPRPRSRHSSPLHAPTPIMGTINDHAKHLEDIVDESVPPLPPPQLPQSMTHLQEPPKQIFSLPIPPAPQRAPSAMPSYGGEVPAAASAPVPPSASAPPGPGPASNNSTPAVQPETPASHQNQRTAGFTNPATYPSVQSLTNNAMYYPMTNPYTNGMGRYPPFVQTQYPQNGGYNLPSSSSGAQNYMGGAVHQQQQQQQQQQQVQQPQQQQQQQQTRNSWAGYPAAPVLSSAAPQHAPTQHAYASAADAQRNAAHQQAAAAAYGTSYPSATSTAAAGGTASHPQQYPATHQQAPSMMVPRQYADRSSWNMPSLGSFGAATEQPNPWPHTA